MKHKTGFIALIMIACVVALSCGCRYVAPSQTITEADASQNAADTDGSSLSTSPSNVIYMSGSLSAGTYTGLNESAFDFHPSNDLRIYFNSQTDKSTRENVGAASIQINGKLIHGHYERTEVYTAIEENNGRMKHLREADLYTGTVNGETVEYLCRSGTNELLRLYGKQSFGGETTKHDFSCEMATEKATELIVSLYGQETADHYTHIQTSFVDNYSKYCVLYVRFCYGYMTEEQIAVYYTPQGELSDVVALKKGYVDVYEEQLTTDMISQAEETLRSAVTEGSIGGFRIMLSADGTCYLEAQALVEKERPAWYPAEDDSNVYNERILLYVPLEA